MEEKPSFQPYLLSTILMAGGGWVGLYFLLNFTLPLLGARWGLFALIFIALAGTYLPIAFFSNYRRGATPTDFSRAVMRESILAGSLGALITWLQLGRILSFGLGIFITLTFIAIGYSFRLREQAQPTKEQTAFTRDNPYEG